MRMTAVLIACAISFGMGQRAEAQNSAPSPILVELFTSEGCSSCPPADARLQQMDAAQFLGDAQLIVLSEHVDYLNQDGWKDPYSAALFTQRQGDMSSPGIGDAVHPAIHRGRGQRVANG